MRDIIGIDIESKLCENVTFLSHFIAAEVSPEDQTFRPIFKICSFNQEWIKSENPRWINADQGFFGSGSFETLGYPAHDGVSARVDRLI